MLPNLTQKFPAGRKFLLSSRLQVARVSSRDQANLQSYADSVTHRRSTTTFRVVFV